MSTSIITSTTFTVATIIDLQAPVSVAATPVNSVVTVGVDTASTADEIEITACMLNALPRCGLTARNHCGQRTSCKS